MQFSWNFHWDNGLPHSRPPDFSVKTRMELCFSPDSTIKYSRADNGLKWSFRALWCLLTVLVVSHHIEHLVYCVFDAGPDSNCPTLTSIKGRYRSWNNRKKRAPSYCYILNLRSDLIICLSIHLTSLTARTLSSDGDLRGSNGLSSYKYMSDR